VDDAYATPPAEPENNTSPYLRRFVPIYVEMRVRQDIDDPRDKLSYSANSRRQTTLLSRVSRARALPGSNRIEGDRGPGVARRGRRRGPARHLQ